MNDFQWALSQLKAGYSVRRSGWNGKNQFVLCDKFHQSPQIFLGNIVNENAKSLPVQPSLALKTEANTYQPGWVPSTGDLFALDWELDSTIAPI